MTHDIPARAACAAIAAYLVGVPLLAPGVPGWNGHDVARAAQLPLLLVCTLAWLLAPARPGRGPTVAGVVLLLLAVLSVLHAPMPAMALRELSVLAGLCAVAAAVAGAPHPGPAAAKVVVAAAAAYAAVLLLIAVVVLASGGVPSRVDLFVGYVNHRFYSHVVTAAAPLLLAVTQWPAVPRRWRQGALATLAAVVALLLATAGRGTLVGLVAATAVITALLGRRAWPVVRALAVAAGAGAALFALLFLLWPAVGPGAPDPLADYGAARMTSDQARGYLWQVAWAQIQSSPWLGIGPLHYAHGANAKAAHPHNLALQIAAEWGLPMALLLLALVTAWLLRIARRLRRPALDPGSRNVGAALAIGVLAVLIDAQVSGNLVMPVSQVWSAVLAGAMVAWLRQDAPAPPVPAGPWARRAHRAAVAALLLAQAVVLVRAWPEARDLPAFLQRLQQEAGTERVQPRFWSAGRF